MHTIEGVEICSVGMDWPAATGTTQITFENIRDAIAAANDDPHICTPRGKLGHFSGLNKDIPMWEPFEALGDAAPAFGTFTNLRATNDGATLVGDAINVPDWINAGTYPNRSMESVGNVKTPGGKAYSMVVTGVAWLGQEVPAVSDLDDLVAFIEKGPTEMAGTAQKTAASISTGLVRSEFHKWADEGEVEGFNTYWWWARDIRVDPDEVIADDDEGGLFRVPFTTDGKAEVTFGEPVKVIEQFADAPVAASQADSLRVLATFSRPNKRMAEKQVAATQADDPDTKEINMDPEVRAALEAQGIDPDTATEEQVSAAEAQVAEQEAPEDDEAGDGSVESPKGEEDPEESGEALSADPIAAAEAKRVDRLERENVALKARLDKRDQEEVAARRDSKIETHIAAGRLAPADRKEYRELMDLDEDRVDGILASRPESVPVGERGEVVDRDGGNTALSAGENGLLAENVSILTPAERARAEAKA